jgi:hypothetical protein
MRPLFVVLFVACAATLVLPLVLVAMGAIR